MQQHRTQEEGSCSWALICSFLFYAELGRAHHFYGFFIILTGPSKMDVVRISAQTWNSMDCPYHTVSSSTAVLATDKYILHQ